MSRIVVITHEYDCFHSREYFLKLVLHSAAQKGHEIFVTASPDTFVDADLAILHVDLTITPPEYVALARRYPQVVNLGPVDIRKRSVSGAFLKPGEDWRGPVMVKADLNANGEPERHHNRVARRLGHPLPFPDMPVPAQYRVFDTLAAVPSHLRKRPDLVIEKYLSEYDGEGYRVYFWNFFGEETYCDVRRTPDRIVKGGRRIVIGETEVPEEIKAECRRLGFQYGKFDFVVFDGKPVLLDANKTPGAPPHAILQISARAGRFADGMLSLLDGNG